MSRDLGHAAQAVLCALITTSAGMARADLLPIRNRPAPVVTPHAKPAAVVAVAAASATVAPPVASAAVAPPAVSAAVAPAAVTSAAVAPPVSSAAVAPPGAGSARTASPAPSASAPGRDDLCSDSVGVWAKGASQRTGLEISASSCASGIVRFKVAGAGCDFEVAKQRGFQRTEGGAFGVSPIANIEWGSAPEPMKKALAGLLSALEQDPSLSIPDGAPVYRAEPPPVLLGSRFNQIAAGAAALLGATALALWLKRRRVQPGAPPPPLS